MATRKALRKSPAKSVTLPTEDQLRAERIEEIKQLPYIELTERIGDDGLPVAGSWKLSIGCGMPRQRD
jgi:hypothetical protein